jgi:hypothetical protein
VTTGGQRDGLFVVHRHAGKGLTDLRCGLQRVRNTVDALRVHIDQTHLDGSQWVLHAGGVLDVLIAVVAWGEPFFF